MLCILKGELIKKGLDPVKALTQALHCSEKTARNKINEATALTLPEADKIVNSYFKKDKIPMKELFKSDSA